MATNPNDSAFTNTKLHLDETNLMPSQSLTKREYFAGLAMQGILAGDRERYLVNDGFLHHPSVAEESALMADALIIALNKGA